MNLFEDLRNRIGKSVAETGQASKRMIEMSKINFKRKEKKREADAIAVEIGWKTYDQWNKEKTINLNNHLVTNLEKLQRLQDEIDALDAELENIRNDKAFLPDPSVPLSLPTTEPISLLVYLCPYCAHQVGEEDQKCHNCHKRFY